jgi:hypothetical protein
MSDQSDTTESTESQGGDRSDDTEQSDETTEPGDDLDALKTSLANERKRRETTQRELDELRRKHMTDDEKKLAEARAEGRKAAMSEVRAERLASAVLVAASGKMADPHDAVHLLGDLDGLVDEDGKVDAKAVAGRIDTLVKDKPYLAVGAAKAASAAKAPQGAREDGTDGNASGDSFLRAAVHRRRTGG